MSKMDTNHNGYIDYTEFLAGCMKSKIYLKEDYLRAAFSYFDKVIIFFSPQTFIGSKWNYNSAGAVVDSKQR